MTPPSLPSAKTLLRAASGVIVLAVCTSGILQYAFGIDLLDALPGRSICPFHLVFGLPCPGCGMTRAFLAIGQLRFARAAAFNPFSLLLFSLVLVYVIAGKVPEVLRNQRFLAVLLAAILLFWGLRLWH